MPFSPPPLDSLERDTWVPPPPIPDDEEEPRPFNAREFAGLPPAQFAPSQPVPEGYVDPNDPRVPTFPEFLFSPSVQVPRLEHPPDESLGARAVRSALNVGGELATGLSTPAFFAAPLPALGAALPEMVSGQVERVKEAEETPPLSWERMEAGGSTVAQIIGAALGGKAALKGKPQIPERPEARSARGASEPIEVTPDDLRFQGVETTPDVRQQPERFQPQDLPAQSVESPSLSTYPPERFAPSNAPLPQEVRQSSQGEPTSPTSASQRPSFDETLPAQRPSEVPGFELTPSDLRNYETSTLVTSDPAVSNTRNTPFRSGSTFPNEKIPQGTEPPASQFGIVNELGPDIQGGMRPPKKLYRGVTEEGGEQSGYGTFALGKGLYSSRDKSFARKYGNKVIEVHPDEGWPSNPLVIQNAAGGAPQAFANWILQNFNFKNIREFNKAYPDPGEFVRAQGYDGVIVGDEIVKYPRKGDEGSGNVPTEPVEPPPQIPTGNVAREAPRVSLKEEVPNEQSFSGETPLPQGQSARQGFEATLIEEQQRLAQEVMSDTGEGKISPEIQAKLNRIKEIKNQLNGLESKSLPKSQVEQPNIPEPERPLPELNPDEARYQGVTQTSSLSEAPRAQSQATREGFEATPKVTSTKNAVTAAKREEFGLSPAAEAARREDPAVWEEARKIHEADPDAPARLVESLEKDPRPIKDVENHLMLRRQIELERQRDTAIDTINSATDEAVKSDANVKLERAREELQKIYDIDKAVGRQAGLGFRARQIMAAHDFSLARMEATTRAVVNEGKPLSAKQAADVKALHERIATAEKKLGEYESRDRLKQVVDESLKEAREARQAKRKLSDYTGDKAENARARLREKAGRLNVGLDPTTLVDYAIIGADYLAKGIDASAALLREFGETVKPHLQAILKQARQIHDAREKGYGKLSQEERLANALRGDKKRIVTRTEQIREKLEKQDFSKPEKRQPRMDQEKVDLLFEYQKAKEEYFAGMYEAKRASRTGLGKVGGAVKDVVQLSRTLITSFDFPPVFRQAGFMTYGAPKITARNVPEAFRAIFSEKQQFRINQELQNRRNAPLYHRDKLPLTDFSGKGSLRRAEEDFQSRLLHKLPWWTGAPILRGGGRGYTTLLNLVRADAYDMFSAQYPGGKPPPAQGRLIAKSVGDFTGRSSLGGLEKSAETMNALLFAPRLMASRFRIALGGPLWKGDIHTRKIMAKMYGRTLAGVATMYGLGIAAGAKVEPDPRSSDFGKLRFGKTRLDPLFGLSQVVAFMTRIITGEQKSSTTGEIKPLRDRFRPLDYFRDTPLRKKKFREDTTSDIAKRFVRSKAAPVAGQVYDFFEGEQAFKKPRTPVTPMSVVEAFVKPISVDDILATMEEQGMEKGAALSFISLWGMGLQTYSLDSDKPISLSDAMEKRWKNGLKKTLVP